MKATNKSGRKFQERTWEPEFRLHFRPYLQRASDIHLLLFLAGNKVDVLIENALREFIRNHNLELDNIDNQTLILLESAKYFLAHGKSPTAEELLNSVDRMDLIDRVMYSISESSPPHKNGIQKTSHQIKPEKVSVLGEEFPSTNLQNENSNPENHQRQPTEESTSTAQTVQQVSYKPPAQEQTSTRDKPPLDFGGGTDTLNIEPATNETTSAKSRWLRGHNSY